MVNTKNASPWPIKKMRRSVDLELLRSVQLSLWKVYKVPAKELIRSPVLVLVGVNELREIPWSAETGSSTRGIVQHT